MKPQKLNLDQVTVIEETNPENTYPDGIYSPDLGEGLFKAKMKGLEDFYYFINTVGGVIYPFVGAFASPGMYEVTIS